MARINIEDQLFDDPRFKALEKKAGDLKAWGVWVRACKVAQRFWKQEKLIPTELFDMLDHAQDLVDCGLAERKENGVYFKGTKEHLGWLPDRLKAAKSAGKASAEKRACVKKRNAAHINEINNIVQPNVNQTQPSSSYSSSFSFSNYKNKEKNKEENCVFSFNKAFQKYPKKSGEQSARIQFSRLIKSSVDYDNLLIAIKNYSDHCALNLIEEKFIRTFASFLTDWRDWVDKKTGNSDADWAYIFGETDTRESN